jgi:hypothetical protein
MKDPKVSEWEARQAQDAKNRAERAAAAETERRATALEAATTSHERSTIWNVLILAAEKYDENANAMRAAGQDRLADAFVQQAKDARALMERFEP